MPPMPKSKQLSYKGRKAKKKKDTFYPSLKRTDSNFSKSIRLSYIEIVRSPEDVYCRCYTCGKLIHIKEIQDGHYIKRNRKSVRFDRNNSRPQGVCCNLYGKGEQEKFRAHLIEEIGAEKVADLELRGKIKITRIPKEALRIINDESKEIINKICKERGIEKW